MKASKLTIAHYNNIIATALINMQEYTDYCLRSAKFDDTKLLSCDTQEQMYKGKNEDSITYFVDLCHMQKALHTFVLTKNVEQLQDSIITQDTFVREFYADTLHYLEDNCLVIINNYCF
jgi:hypothetical protein